MSITGRAEKTRTLGCEEWRGGIRVHAERMAAPFDTYVAISTWPSVSEQLFTMEAHLTNENPQAAASENVGDVPAGRQLKKATDSADPNVSISDATQVAARDIPSYDADEEEFQRRFSTLEKPGPNLRWYPNLAFDGPDEQEMSDLVTPYGPCGVLIGNTRAGYNVSLVDLNPYKPEVPMTIVGSFPSRTDAMLTLEERCQAWYAQVKGATADPAREQHLWFSPDVIATERPASPLSQQALDLPAYHRLPSLE